ncbi:BZ3500_MvSof-1268-A1-R1_Chr1-3g01745 [Microbotryum saponariae]|uniref:BZ3500_MvSof-1268-A1-R1_Chr1-3g01745 protein n=1 Tax=Microbotryum saponariae TaxID=289078 RepID=A0A2X0M7H6_9BASI|nr:BZ3500_MvSof-1268-A1-R1_Chr1-3g01745 [Microbotryum saponariae]SCZ94506.1 BZ3501_MvSof-1269-A2-R1_Chr1-3g01347 [Microbotryum saponariae]
MPLHGSDSFRNLLARSASDRRCGPRTHRVGPRDAQFVHVRRDEHFEYHRLSSSPSRFWLNPSPLPSIMWITHGHKLLEQKLGTVPKAL